MIFSYLRGRSRLSRVALLIDARRGVQDSDSQVMELLDHKPIGLEGFDEHLVNDLRRKSMNPANLKLLPSGRAITYEVLRSCAFTIDVSHICPSPVRSR